MMRKSNTEAHATWNSLIIRNNELACTVVQLRAENDRLKRLLRTDTRKLFQSISELSINETATCEGVNKETQTGDSGDFKAFTPKARRFSSITEGNGALDGSGLMTPKRRSTEAFDRNAVFVTHELSPRTGSSPAIARVQEALISNCMEKPRRSSRAPVSYKEPSLRVKVRKGFQFFKFSD